MTDPTPIRAEVDRFGCDQLGMDKMPDGEWVRFTDYQALRERAEAAEAERDEALNQLDSAKHSVDVLCRRITTTNAAWNDAIEAAASVYLNGANPNTWDYFSLARHEIRALRRAAPTEGEA